MSYFTNTTADKIAFSHNSISSHFKDGRTFEQSKIAIRSGGTIVEPLQVTEILNPSSPKFYRYKVRDGNRRLYVYKQLYNEGHRNLQIPFIVVNKQNTIGEFYEYEEVRVRSSP